MPLFTAFGFLAPQTFSVDRPFKRYTWVDVHHVAHAIRARHVHANDILAYYVSMPMLVYCRWIVIAAIVEVASRLALRVGSLGVHEQGNDESVKT
jgi:hypothetical protein